MTPSELENAVLVETEPDVGPGDSGEVVEELHEALSAAGFPVVVGLLADLAGPVGKVFDEPTEQAVRSFQSERDLPVTGEVDTATWAELAAGIGLKASRLSEQGARFIAGFEGWRPSLYNDPAGHCTIGYGHLVHMGPCDGREPTEFKSQISRQRGLELLRQDASEATAAITKLVKVDLNQQQFDALVSFVFNVGGGAFRDSTLLQKLNQGQYDEVPAQLKRWIYGGGKPLEGLRRRRIAEGALFLQGDYGGGGGQGPGGLSTRQVQQALRTCGWPLVVDGAMGPRTFEAIRDFQRGFAFWQLGVDGAPGAKTQEALRKALDLGGRCSPHFAFREFKSKGNGWIKVSRTLVLGLEEYREVVDGPVAIVSGYRDPAHNVAVGGARNSQHLYGNAVDLQPVKSIAEVRRLRCFSGIGYQAATGRVRHVDVRHVGPNTTGNTIGAPAVWAYGRSALMSDGEEEDLLGGEEWEPA